MVQDKHSFERAINTTSQEDELDFDRQETAQPEGGFENQEPTQRNLGRISYEGFSEDSAPQTIENPREAECLKLIAENPYLEDDYPYLLGLTPNKINQLKVVTLLINQPAFSFIQPSAGSAIARRLGLNAEEWENTSIALRHNYGIMKTLRDRNIKTGRSQGEILDIEAIVNRVLSSERASRVLPFLTDNLLRFLIKRIDGPDVMFSEEDKQNYQSKLEEIINLRNQPKSPPARKRPGNNHKKSELDSKPLEIYSPFEDPHFASEEEVLEDLSTRQLNYLKLTAYLIDQPDFTFHHPDNASGNLVKNVGIDPRQWEDIKQKLQFKYHIIGVTKKHPKATRSMGVTLNIDSLLEYALDNNHPFITDGLLDKLKSRLCDDEIFLSHDEKENYLSKLNAAAKSRALWPHTPEEKAAVKKARKLERERSYYYAQRKTITPKRHKKLPTEKPIVNKHVADSGQEIKLPQERIKKPPKRRTPKKRKSLKKYRPKIYDAQTVTTTAIRRALVDLPRNTSQESLPKPRKTPSKYKDLNFNFPVPEADDNYDKYYRAKRFGDVSTMDRLLLAIGTSATFATSTEHQLQHASNLVNKHIDENTYTPDEVEGLMRQAEYQSLITIKGSTFELTKLALLKLRKQTHLIST